MAYDKKTGTEKLVVPEGSKGMNVKKERREEKSVLPPYDVDGPGVKHPKMKQVKKLEG